MPFVYDLNQTIMDRQPKKRRTYIKPICRPVGKLVQGWIAIDRCADLVGKDVSGTKGNNKNSNNLN